MDSELLSVFHDDQYESSFNKYEENFRNFWPIGSCESFTPHLSENLNGILPISPIEEKLAYFDNDLQIDHYSNNDVYKQEHMSISDQTQSFMLENYIENGPTIEIISVDPNVEFEEDGEFENNECDKSKYTKNNYCQSLSDDDSQSHATFRSRTESSSIGDYESHTSDESDFENSNECIRFDQSAFSENISQTLNKVSSVEPKHDKKNNIYEKSNNIISHIDFIGSSVMVATNNSNESIEIDTENFDLATFITEDNFITEKLTENSLNDKNFNNKNKNNNGYESEEIVDIETVDDNIVKKHSHSKRETVINNTGKNILNLCINNLIEEDDIKKDPSWDPNCKKKNFQEKKTVDKINEKPNDKNLNIKVIKNQTKKSKPYKNSSIRKKLQKTMQISDKNISFFNQLSACFNENKISIKKEEKTPLVKNCNELNNATKINDKNIIVNKKINLSQNFAQTDKIEKNNINSYKLSGNEVPIVPKKKLNLEEYYKKRKGDLSLKDSKINFASKLSPEKNNKEMKDEERINFKNNAETLLVEQDLPKKNLTQLDHINEVKNKILRMQEMRKKAAQKRLIDIAVSSKVGPVTKILPLEEIIKSNSKHLNYNQMLTNNSVKTEYEEIIIVSVSCNTDIKIPPKFDKTHAKNSSTSLLFNISSTMEKVKSNENFKISNNSLITSIKNVVLQKTAEDVQPIQPSGSVVNKDKKKVENDGKKNITNENIIDQHGEDKIIMHLPKNRVKQKTCNIFTQTESLPEFPLLELIMPIKLNKSRRKNKKYRMKKGEHSSNSSDSERETDNEYNKTRSSHYKSITVSKSTCSISRHISASENCNLNFSESKLKIDSGSISEERNRSRRKLRQNNRTRNYSDSSSHSTSSNYRSRSSSNFTDISRSRSRSRSSERKYNKSTLNYYKKLRSKTTTRNNSPAVEERRIVYVGRIEAETTKEDLKRKFIGYGPIKQITLHYKDTGMKYGFVTFERAEDAFKAIDNGNTDSIINMYDISFGGRRAFCRQSYADLDCAVTNTFQHYSYNSVPSSRNSVLSNNDQDDSFESLLKKVKEKLSASKSSTQKT